MRFLYGTALVSLTLVLFAAGRTQAGPRLFGTTGTGGTTSTLVELDPATGGLLNTIGSVGYGVNGLTYDMATGKLWGSTTTRGNFAGLIEINMTTGAGAPVGSGWGLGTPIVCITTNSAGAMYGWWEPSVDSLVSVDKSLGLSTLVGNSGLDTYALGLSFANPAALYLYNGGGDYYTINTTTGAATYAGNLGTIAHHGAFNPVSNIYYGISDPWEVSKNLVLLDLVGGSYVGTLQTVDNLHTLTWVPDQGPDPIPEAGTLVALSGFLSSGGLLWWRRRRA